MERITAIADKYGLRIIEDATEALGTYYTDGSLKGRFAGTIGDVGVYSFNGNKIITTGGGGMIVSRHPEMLDHAHHLTTQAKSDELNYLHDEVGYNYRLTNLQAALGVAQMEQLDGFIQTKNENHQLYRQGLENSSTMKFLGFREDIRSNCWFYSVYLMDNAPLSRDELIRRLSGMGVQCRPIWGLIHDQMPYQGSRAYQIEKAKEYWQHIVNIPCSTNLTKEDVGYVLECLHALMSGK